MPTTLINVSNRLPVTVGEQIKKSSGGLVAALEGMGDERYALKWLGWPGGEIDDAVRREEVERTLEREHGCTPVFLTKEEVEGHYEGFSNTSVWPLLHYMPTMFRYESQWWDHYQNVNRKFAEKILSVARDGDLVWVHDYQLMLLPAMLKWERPSLRVGFFLHTPFPSYEVFRYHPRREDLVQGLLGADQLGFHTFGYLRHFRSSVLRLLGIESEMMRIRHHGHTAHLGVYPIGINAPRFVQELDRPQYREKVEHFRDVYRGKRLILSVERLDYTKGLLRRLKAIDLFLAKITPEERDQVKFIFISIPSREGVDEYRALREDVEARVGRLNGRYATLNNSPIHFIHGSVQFTELCALYGASAVGLVTPLVDGMNLVAKEYVACQRDDPGVLVLSEFAGAAEELFHALLVNPYDPGAIAEALRQALAMPEDERRRRMAPMREHVVRLDAARWAKSFIDDLASREIAGVHAHPAAAAAAAARLAEALGSGGRVAMFLDYDGTLREIERDPASATPHNAVRHLLDALAAYRAIDVTIISGRTPADLESFLGSYDFGLVAEHGAAVRRPGHTEWERADRNITYDWKDEILKVLRLYQESTPGSAIEDKRTSLVWHYRRADPEFGEWKAKQLATDLSAMVSNEPINVRHGRKIVEVTASQVNKGAAVVRCLEDKTYALVLMAGDDTTDESMFRLGLHNQVTIRVGDAEDSHAQYSVPSPRALRRFLEDALRANPAAPARESAAQ
jgi:trehalose 6-phosphate synthase/phosphatase